MSNLRHFYDPVVLVDNFKFTESGIYKSPIEGKHNDYVEYIVSLPNSEGPDVFGMHENALITFQLQESNKISNVVLSIQPRASGSGGGKKPDEIVGELAVNIASSLPGMLTPHEVAQVEPIYGENRQMSSLMVVLFQVLNHIIITHNYMYNRTSLSAYSGSA